MVSNKEHFIVSLIKKGENVMLRTINVIPTRGK